MICAFEWSNASTETLTKKETETCIFEINEITEFCQDRRQEEMGWDIILGIVFSKVFIAVTKFCYFYLWSSSK